MVNTAVPLKHNEVGFADIVAVANCTLNVVVVELAQPAVVFTALMVYVLEPAVDVRAYTVVAFAPRTYGVVAAASVNKFVAGLH